MHHKKGTATPVLRQRSWAFYDTILHSLKAFSLFLFLYGLAVLGANRNIGCRPLWNALPKSLGARCHPLSIFILFVVPKNPRTLQTTQPTISLNCSPLAIASGVLKSEQLLGLETVFIHRPLELLIALFYVAVLIYYLHIYSFIYLCIHLHVYTT